MSSASGDLLVKPCTHDELNFYSKSSKPDPSPDEFAYYMPTFYGTLEVPSSRSAPSACSALLHVPLEAALHTPISHLPVKEGVAPTLPPRSWIPTNGAKIKAETSIVLENVASRLVKPNVLDVKLGARLWDDKAPEAKRIKLDKQAGETTSRLLGYRIAGMKIWGGHDALKEDTPGVPNGVVNEDNGTDWIPPVGVNGYKSYDRDYGKKLKAEKVKKAFESFFYVERAGVTRKLGKEIVGRCLEDVKDLYAVMEKQETRMYSSSLLFVYEGDGNALKQSLKKEDKMIATAKRRLSEAGAEGVKANGSLAFENSGAPRTAFRQVLEVDQSLEQGYLAGVEKDARNGDDDDDDTDDEDEDELPRIQAMKMIDFAHAEWVAGCGPDENVLHGIRNVIKIFEEMLDDR